MRRHQSYPRPESTYKPDNKSENPVKLKKKTSSPERDMHKIRDKQANVKIWQSNHQYLRENTGLKQKNFSPDITGSQHSLDEQIFTEVSLKPDQMPKQRSKSTVSDRQPWGQLLHRTTGGEHESVFGKCDPLRTLHFLARELQTLIQTRMPEETNLQEITKAMHAALKRIPPEVASTVQLQQQTLDLLPKLKCLSSRESMEVLNCERSGDNEKGAQTLKKSRSKEFSEFQKLIEGNNMKLDAACKQLESILCGQLRDEKSALEVALQNERASVKSLQHRIQEMENTNAILRQQLSQKDEEIVQLKTKVAFVDSKLQERTAHTTDVQATLAELKKSKWTTEQDNLKLEHQLRLCAIEKEKYLAILAVRDKQIYEIRNEMTQLQQSVNEQLVEMHNYAIASVPSNRISITVPTANAGTISSIYGSDELFPNKSDQSLPDLDESEDEGPQRT
ncbi:uncharacterized protein LOC126744471 isoform X2 [Anthonomus grandis grandis]|uniref:uncharacterized protein LOC126744471 isoform X2 n=1 Tax=Anthonomus grandis grandis TaxID=2921223 RepID=UPI002166BE42|nr:uncharacterized protein LOC126744471 isoform X2 [Anthonomus grandis grandis]